MPKRKHPFFSKPLSALKRNAPMIDNHAYQTGICSKTENEEHFAHQGWERLGDAFEQNLFSDSETERMGQTSISSTWSQADNVPPLIKSLDDNEDNDVEICSQSPAHLSGKSYDENDADVHINSICSPSQRSEALNKSQSSYFNVESSSDNESIIIINNNINSDEPSFENDTYSGISDESIIMIPSPNLVNKAFYFGSQTSESKQSFGMDEHESNQGNETVSISSGSASPERQNILKGSEWLQSVVSKMPVENNAAETPPRETFKKMSVLKGGLAEKLENVLLDLQTDATLSRKTNPSGNSDKLQIKILNMAVISVCHVVADCDQFTSSTESTSMVELDIPAGHGLAIILTNSMVQRWTICKNCVLSIKSTWQILHVPALQKSFIMCPTVTDVHHSLDSDNVARRSEHLNI